MAKSLIERARGAPGPLVIVGRPHSGTRLLARTFMLNGIFIGAVLSDNFLDSISWYQRFVVPLMSSRFFPCWAEHESDSMFVAFRKKRLADTLRHFFGATEPGRVWGWKFAETLFVMPVIKKLFPKARFVHIIRDGRDVCLSDRGYFQLTSSHTDPPGWNPPALGLAQRSSTARKHPTFREFCLCVTFGDPNLSNWRGLNLSDRQHLTENRFLLQMQSWINCINFARRFGEGLSDDYRELRYEDLCANPVAEARLLSESLGMPLRPGVETFLERAVSRSQMRKWERVRFTMRESRDFANAVEWGTPLLRELGYVE